MREHEALGIGQLIVWYETGEACPSLVMWYDERSQIYTIWAQMLLK
jgi:hypothetical protein